MKKMKELPFVLYVICVLLPWQAYANDFTIAVSIAPEIEFVQEVVGERAKIVCVIPEGEALQAMLRVPRNWSA